MEQSQNLRGYLNKVMQRLHLCNKKAGFHVSRFYRHIAIALFLFAMTVFAAAYNVHVSDANGIQVSGLNIVKTPNCVVDADGYGDYSYFNQSVMDACQGGTIYLKCGTYTISEKILLRSNTDIVGDGKCSVIKMADTFGNDTEDFYMMLTDRNITGVSGGLSNITLSNFVVDGNIDNNQHTTTSKTYGIRFLNCGTDINVDGVIVHGINGYGLIFDNCAAKVTRVTSFNNTVVGIFTNYGKSEISFSKIYGNNIGIQTSENWGTISFSEVYSNKNIGIYLLSSSSESLPAKYKRVVGNYVHDNTNYGIYVNGMTTFPASDNTFVGNTVWANGGTCAITEIGLTENNTYVGNVLDDGICRNSTTDVSIGNMGDDTNRFQGGIETAGTIDGATLNTGQGDNELYDMDQNVMTTSTVVFDAVNDADLSGSIDASSLEYGMVAYFGMDNGSGSTAYDSSMYGNDCTLDGVTFIDGKSNWGTYYNGTGAYADCGRDASLNMGDGDFTLVAWINNTGASADSQIISKGGSFRYQMYLNAAGNLILQIDDDTTLKSVTSSTSGLDDSDWHFVVGMRDGTDIKVYVDGELKGTTDIGSYGSLDDASGKDLCLGVASTNEANNPYQGVIDGVRVYKRAISQAEINALKIGMGATATGHLASK